VKKIKIVFSMLFVTLILYSHPHLWIEYNVEPIFSDEAFEGLQVEWSFDEMFSWEIMMDYTENQNCNISETENKIIEKEAFSYLKESNYFAHFCENEKKKDVKVITNFWAECKDNILIYHFFIPWKIEVTKEINNLKISFFDETIFCEIIPKKNSMTIKNNDNIFIQTTMLDKITHALIFTEKNNETE